MDTISALAATLNVISILVILFGLYALVLAMRTSVSLRAKLSDAKRRAFEADHQRIKAEIKEAHGKITR